MKTVLSVLLASTLCISLTLAQAAKPVTETAAGNLSAQSATEDSPSTVGLGTNLVQNSGFEQGDAGWRFTTSNGASGSSEVTGGLYCAILDETGENPWDAGLYTGNVVLEEGALYALTFDVVVEQTAQLAVKLGQRSPPYQEYFFQRQRITNDPQTVTMRVESAYSDAESVLEFFFGGDTVGADNQVCLDNISLIDVSTQTSVESVPPIRVDQFGYLPDAPKVAVIVDPDAGFNAEEAFTPGEVYEVRRAEDDSVVYSGAPAPWQGGAVQENSGDRGWWFDFSELSEPGSYYIYDAEHDVRSYAFEISRDVYAPILDAALRMFYYNRANTPREVPYADERWTDGVTFAGPGQDTETRFVGDKENPETARDLSGGWFDAGDYNKYVTFAQAPVHTLLSAYENNPEAFHDSLNIPESGNGLPDIIDELLWEFEWLKKMQVEDGGVIIKVGNIDFNSVSPPSEDGRPRYYGPVCSSSSIAAASMFAHGALVFAEFAALEGEAADLAERAVAAYDWYSGNPRETECDTGEIKAGDADLTLRDQDASHAVAAVYLFALTGEERYQKALEEHYLVTRPFGDEDLRWGMYNPHEGDALLYYAGLENAAPNLKELFLETKVEQAYGVAERLYRFRPGQDLYRAYMPDQAYHWGSNYVRAALGNTNLDMLNYGLDEVAHPEYEAKALGIVNYFHGVNPLGLVYLSNMYDYGAENAVNEYWHDWFQDGGVWDHALLSGRGPAPGYLVGGPNAAYTGTMSPPAGQPLQKSYRDMNMGGVAAWEITEPAIYYQAAYVKLLSNFVGN